MNDIVMEVEPFEYFIIDNFLPVDKAKKLSDEFPDYHSPNWYDYDNPLELKKTIECNQITVSITHWIQLKKQISLVKNRC
jgi:hypothetical protein